ncbi:oxygen-dependent protoporphyrinogen oxidase [Streptoalloteichus tenebrarius]|uniref:Coproporphyrinogen III oxidase n=1 Tax=Streptoalloteichus tenebrarius (strain ATCC 17920 / DSM 40477 / JCM 4838 / CBS 697.72 / NBRC 16177 / NCIMB 11028 / NRRL B-12390 / A12253. 1 / ISP 5477) TaxID=1933 RepID=A0ABT1HS27_STRSD|nr:protoporphyrinogen oxidase [Streptoalloteichus tenebrarius]MCP2258312.1 oxygen-dependent protoporphyrinogen oxidase [Streptoalloteichus tenebrarius]BFF03476.1 protoporphyrinogen oxidase [Streptoalloteichus tenebrarius]
MTVRRVLVVGGGITGLVAAHRLRVLLGERAEIVLVEQSDRLGGKLRTVELAGAAYDVGAEAFLLRRPEVADLVAELGLSDLVVSPALVASRVRASGRTVPVPPRTLMGVPAAPEALREVLSPEALRRVANEPELPPIDLAGADVSVGRLLRGRLGDEVVDRLVDPLLGGVYAGRADNLGLRATMPQLAAALDRGAGSLVRATSDLVPPPDPRLPRPPVFGALRGGFQVLVDRLASASRARVRLGQPVRSLLRTERGWRVEIGSAPRPEAMDVDGVVLAVPAPAARRLLADVAPAAAAAYGRVEVASMVVVAMALPADTRLPESSGVLVAEGERWADGTPFTAKAFTFSSRKWGHLGDRVLVRGSVGRFGEAAALRRDDGDLVRAVRADLAELTGVAAEPLDVAVVRWGGGLPQYGVDHVDVVAAIEETVSHQPGLAVAGATLHGVGLPACVATADAAARRVAAHLSTSAAPASGTMGPWPA